LSSLADLDRRKVVDVIAVTRLLARFPTARLANPSFTPTYGGAVGELRLQSLPLRIH
jgi:hypothetical protein